MKKLLIFVVSLCSLQSLYSQNLVPNSGFELDTSCNMPSGAILFGYVPPWDSPTDASPDAFTLCSPFLNSSVPLNNFGYQYPHNGNGYAGFGLYSVSSSYNREYIQVELDTLLVEQQKYCVSFYVSFGNKEKIANNNFGVYFSSNHTYIPTTINLNLVPQINDTNIISDTANWTLVSGEIIAQGGEKYIIIGNFYPNSLTDTVHVTGGISENYYFIDDVDVHQCGGAGVDERSGAEDVSVYPNPVTDVLTIEIKQKAAIEIKDITGRMLYKEKINKGTASVDISGFAKGVYFLEAKTEEKIIRKKIIKQ